MKLIAVRHGETEWNLQGREMGQLDSPLTLVGVQQAHALAQRLAQVPFEALYTSDLGRARHTAEVIAKVCSKPVVAMDSLRERHMGIFQGLTPDEIHRTYPLERAAYEEQGADYIIPGGESANQRVARSVRAITDLALMHEGSTVVAVTHGGFLMGLFEHIVGLPPGNGWRFRRHNGSYSVFEFIGGKWHLETWNDISHLAGLKTLHDPSFQEAMIK